MKFSKYEASYDEAREVIKREYKLKLSDAQIDALCTRAESKTVIAKRWTLDALERLGLIEYSSGEQRITNVGTSVARRLERLSHEIRGRREQRESSVTLSSTNRVASVQTYLMHIPAESLAYLVKLWRENKSGRAIELACARVEGYFGKFFGSVETTRDALQNLVLEDARAEQRKASEAPARFDEYLNTLDKGTDRLRVELDWAFARMCFELFKTHTPEERARFVGALCARLCYQRDANIAYDVLALFK